MKIFLPIIIALFLFCACTKEENAIIRPVEYIVVNNQNPTSEKEFFGYLKASSLVDLSFRIEGVLTDIFPKEGEVVKKGQIIATLDSPLYEIEKKESKFNLSNAIIQYENAKNYYNRIEKLHKAGGISDNDFDSAKTKMESAKFQIEVATQRLKYKTSQSGYSNIVAPKDGIIVRKIASSGQYLNPGDTVVKFQNLDGIDAYIFVSQNYVNYLRAQQSAKVKIDAFKDELFDAKIKEISTSSLDGLSYRVKLKILKQSEKLKDGMSASAIFNIKENNTNKIQIPITSVLKENNTDFVFTIINKNNGIGEIKKQEIILDEIEGNFVNVKSGLKNGDFVVAKGVSEVTQSQKVRYEY